MLTQQELDVVAGALKLHEEGPSEAVCSTALLESLAERWERRAGGPEMRDRGSDYVQGMRSAYTTAAADLRAEIAKLSNSEINEPV